MLLLNLQSNRRNDSSFRVWLQQKDISLTIKQVYFNPKWLTLTVSLIIKKWKLRDLFQSRDSRKILVMNVNFWLLSQKVISSILYTREFISRICLQQEPPDGFKVTDLIYKFMIHSACDFKPFPHLLDHYCKQTSKPSNDHGFCFKNKVICCDEGLTLETPASETIDSTQFTLSLQIRKPTYRVIPLTDAVPQFL